MSDREFDNYLTLLAGLLRLGRGQRDQIAKELRAHLDDRLEELLAEGVSREEAIQRALAEFGDAAGLAGEFASIARGRNRRWLMRVTTFSVAATILIAAGLITFWPGRNAGPGVAQVAAQNAEEGAAQPDGAQREAERAGRHQSVEDALKMRSDFEFVEIPLRDALALIENKSGLQIIPDTRRLEESGVSIDTPVTRNLRGVRVSTFLDLLLREFELTYVEQDEELILIVTTPEDAESTMLIRVYDCRDLLSMPWPDPARNKLPHARSRPAVGSARDPLAAPQQPSDSPTDPLGTPADPFGSPQVPTPDTVGDPFGSAPSREIVPQFGDSNSDSDKAGERKPAHEPTEYEMRVDSLIDLIKTNVDPDSWDDVGGPGSISEYAGLVVVTQTAQTHKKVERVLDMLRQAAGLEKPEGGGVVR